MVAEDSTISCEVLIKSQLVTGHVTYSYPYHSTGLSLHADGPLVLLIREVWICWQETIKKIPNPLIFVKPLLSTPCYFIGQALSSMISSPWRPGSALATQVLEFCKVLDLKVKVLAKLGLGLFQGGVWTGSYKGFAGFGKGFPIFYL